MKIVLDTNIWLSGIFWEGEAFNFIKKIENDNSLIINESIILEIVNVLNKEAKFKKFISNRKLAIGNLIRKILTISKLVPENISLNVIKEHSSDNKIIECAVSGEADFVITYDNHLLKLKEYKGIKILTPKKFLLLIEK